MLILRTQNGWKNHYDYEDFPKAKTHAKHQFEASFADAGAPAVAGAPARRRRRLRQPPARRRRRWLPVRRPASTRAVNKPVYA
jgi:hypothetical protein